MKNRPREIDGTMVIMPPLESDYHKNTRAKLRDYHQEIAYTMTMHGDHDEVPTLLFAGAAFLVLQRAFTFFVKCRIMKRCRLYLHRRYYQRMGKVYTHAVVEMYGYNSQLCTLDNFCLMVENRLKQECWCNVKKFTLNRFVNL